jgi:hypothetical protein
MKSNSNSKSNDKDSLILAAYIPTRDDKTVTDGAPDRFGSGEE